MLSWLTENEENGRKTMKWNWVVVSWSILMHSSSSIIYGGFHRLYVSSKLASHKENHFSINWEKRWAFKRLEKLVILLDNFSLWFCGVIGLFNCFSSANLSHNWLYFSGCQSFWMASRTCPACTCTVIIFLSFQRLVISLLG